MEILELKIAIIQMKNSFEQPNSGDEQKNQQT